MKRWLWVLGFVAIVAFSAFVLSNSQVNLSLASANERSLKVETSFPNATCSKTLSQDFPFAVIRCEEVVKVAEDSINEHESDVKLETKP